MRDRGEQDRRPGAGPGAARAGRGGSAGERPVDPSGERARGRGRRGAPRRARRAPAFGARLLPGRRHDRPARRRSHRGAGARAGASAHA